MRQRRGRVVLRLALRMGAARAARRGLIDPEDYKQFISLLRSNPCNEAGESFDDLLLGAVTAEGLAAGVMGMAEDGTPIIDAFMKLLNWIVENWDVIAKIILFLLALSPQPLLGSEDE